MQTIRIGREPNNDVVINDNTVSRTHCQIIKDDYGNYRLQDLNSANGTYVNGVRRNGEVLLNMSDIVRIGDTTIPWQNYFSSGGASRTVVGASAPMGSAPQPSRQMPPNNFLVWSILATIFCCLPFGIPAIVYSSKVDRLWAMGDYQGAEQAASKARTWFWVSFAVGLLQYIIIIIYYVVLGVAFLS